MPSKFFRHILESEIASKINLLISDENSDITGYTSQLVGKGFDFTLYSFLENASDRDEKRVMDILVDGVTGVINRQVEEYDFFNPSENKSFKYTIEKKVKTKKQGVSGNLRLKSGKFTNPLQLSNLINRILAPLVQKRMGTDGALIYRTGRLAHSGFVTNIIARSATNKSIYFNYLKSPYAVFQPPNTYHGLASVERDPRRLFAKAITDALNKLLHKNELTSNTFNIRIGNYTVGSTRGGVLNER